MAQEMMQCPVCGYVVRSGRHPKDSSMVEVLPQLLGHISAHHLDEVARREALGKSES